MHKTRGHVSDGHLSLLRPVLIWQLHLFGTFCASAFGLCVRLHASLTLPPPPLSPPPPPSTARAATSVAFAADIQQLCSG